MEYIKRNSNSYWDPKICCSDIILVYCWINSTCRKKWSQKTTFTPYTEKKKTNITIQLLWSLQQTSPPLNGESPFTFSLRRAKAAGHWHKWQSSSWEHGVWKKCHAKRRQSYTQGVRQPKANVSVSQATYNLFSCSSGVQWPAATTEQRAGLWGQRPHLVRKEREVPP